MKFVVISILLIQCIICRHIMAQCGCSGNTPEIALGNINELYDDETVTGNNFFVNLLYKYTYADSYFYKDINTGEGAIKYIDANFMDLRVSYKFYSRWIIEIEAGYFINKQQRENLNDELFKSKGFSDITLYGRYIFWKNIYKNFELSGGGGIKIPLNEGSEYIPQNIQSSTGAYAFLINLFFKKYFPDINLGMIAGNRTDYNLENKWDYRYGISSISSLVFLYNASANINFGAELRYDFRAKDYNKGKKNCGSGFFTFSLSPIFRYSYRKFIFGLFYNYPLYQFYNGKQLANKFSFGLNLSLNTNIFN